MFVSKSGVVEALFGAVGKEIPLPVVLVKSTFVPETGVTEKATDDTNGPPTIAISL